MKVLKIIGIVCAVVVVALTAGIMGYSSFYWKNNTSITVTTSYINELTWAEGEKYFIEVNYFSNELGNGAEVFEIRLNYYTDVAEPQSVDCYKNIHGQGVQFVGAPAFSSYEHREWKTGLFGWGYGVRTLRHTPINPFFYNTTNTNGESYTATNELNIRSSWIVDFSGTLAMAAQKGFSMMLQRGEEVPDTNYRIGNRELYEYNDINGFMKGMYDTATGMRNGLRVLEMDMSRWFVGLLFNNETKKFDRVDHGHQNNMFINVKVNRSPNGMITSSQSLFGAVARDFDFAHTGSTANNYSIVNSIYELGFNDFEVVGGALRLRQSVANFLSSFNNLDIVVRLSASEGLIPFADDAFRGLRIKEVIVGGAT
jgi:hypothetical protein